MSSDNFRTQAQTNNLLLRIDEHLQAIHKELLELRKKKNKKATTPKEN